MPPFIELPQSFLDMPRWWHEGQDWLATLPGAAEAACRRWRLDRVGPVMHGSNAIVIPVIRNGEPLALRMAPPDARSRDEIRALRFWDGRGTVRLLDADPALGASLLERLDSTHPLAALPLAGAVPIIARLMRRLAVTHPPADAPATADIARDRAASLPVDWLRLEAPFDRVMLDAAIAAATELSRAAVDLAVNGDLHFEQVLAGEREPWLAVDPMLLRGDIEYDLARILWSRLDEMTSDAEVRHWFDVIVAEAGLDPGRARSWALFRAVDYWLWGLEHGLTEDPPRCARLARIFG